MEYQEILLHNSISLNDVKYEIGVVCANNIWAIFIWKKWKKMTLWRLALVSKSKRPNLSNWGNLTLKEE